MSDLSKHSELDRQINENDLPSNAVYTLNALAYGVTVYSNTELKRLIDELQAISDLDDQTLAKINAAIMAASDF